MSKVVLITGASSGIGKSTAKFLSSKGFKVYGTGRNPKNIKNVEYSLIPLDVTSNQIIYNLSSESNLDIITINYDVEEVFVSRSCGFKAIFNNVSVTSEPSNDWIIGLTETLENSITIPTIDNETSAHIKIFH